MICAKRMNNVLLCKPTYFDVLEVKNPFMRGMLTVDHARAEAEWQAVCKAFQQAGVHIQVIEPVPGLEDMVFAANQSFVGLDQEDRAFMVPSVMLHESRRGEVPYYTEYFQNLGYRIIDLALDEGDYLEGGGDLLWNADWEFVWAGYGHRSTLGGVQAFARIMGELSIPVQLLELVNPTFYHLDTCLAPLTADSIILYPGALAPDSLRELRSKVRTYEVTREEALKMVCNGVSVNGRYITPVLTPSLERALAKENVEPIVVDTSEFAKSGGSVCCLKMMLP